MIRILIYDDEQNQCDELKKLLLDTAKGKPQIDCAVTVSAAMRYLQGNAYDIVFMDIVLDSALSGIELAEDIQQRYPQTRLVYITGFIKYCEEIFRTSPDALMLKPFTEEGVRRVMDILRRKQEKTDHISIAVGKNSIENISLDCITFIETVSRRLTFFDTSFRPVYEFYDLKISDIADRLPPYFVQCHKSFCVNMKYVQSLKRFCFRLEGERNVPVSQNRFKETRDRYFRFLEESL